MKKLIIIMAIILAFSLAACGDSSAVPPASDTPNNSGQSDPATPNNNEDITPSGDDDPTDPPSDSDQDNSKDYDKILEGDLSDFAGGWINGNVEIITLEPDGTVFEGDVYTEYTEDGVTYRYKAAGFTQHEDGHFTWGVNLEDYDGPNGFAVFLYPVGVEVNAGIKTDSTKVRISRGHDLPSAEDEVFYPIGE